MPEAVISNSTAAPADQIDLFKIVDEMENATNALMMLCAFAQDEIEQQSGVSISHGFGHMVEAQIGELNRIQSTFRAGQLPEVRQRQATKGPYTIGGMPIMWPELYDKVSAAFLDVLQDAGHFAPADDIAAWSVSTRDRWLSRSVKFYNMLIAKLNGSRDPMMAGSLLPWLEMVMREEEAGSASVAVDKSDIQTITDRVFGRQQEADRRRAS